MKNRSINNIKFTYFVAMKRLLLFHSILFFFLCIGTELRAQIEYSSEAIKVKRISENTLVHVSYLSTDDFGKVACNGLIYVNKGEAIIFDTPPDSAGSVELINYVTNQLNAKIVAVVPTHFHHDCLGGLDYFHAAGIKSLAHDKTKDLALSSNVPVPQEVFTAEQTVKVGSEKILIYFAGEGHTKDNVIAYVSSDEVLFGGCLIKSMNAGRGNLEDANIADWSATMEHIKLKFPSAKVIVPGHGKLGDQELLNFTADMFRE